MNQFRKKPVVIWAVQFTGDKDPVIDFMRLTNEGESFRFEPLEKVMAEAVLIHTPEGVMRADVGDWIIKGVKGEFYPCKPDIFAATYEPV